MIYLYGFVRPGTGHPPESMEGIDGSAVSLVGLDGLAAVVSDVSEERYGQEAVEQHSQDLAWLGEQGISHERVVTWFVDEEEIVPVPLMTLYSSREHLVRDARERRERVLRAFERLGGRREWDLRVSYDREHLEQNLGRFSDDVAALDRQVGEADPGRRYLLERKRDERVRSAVAETARRLAWELLDHLAELAEESVTVPLPREAAQLPVVLRGALLVARDDEVRLRHRLEEQKKRLGEAGMTAELTGPWAPYRFVEDDDGT